MASASASTAYAAISIEPRPALGDSWPRSEPLEHATSKSTDPRALLRGAVTFKARGGTSSQRHPVRKSPCDALALPTIAPCRLPCQSLRYIFCIQNWYMPAKNQTEFLPQRCANRSRSVIDLSLGNRRRKLSRSERGLTDHWLEPASSARARSARNPGGAGPIRLKARLSRMSLCIKRHAIRCR